jgi:hypothetical protein
MATNYVAQAEKLTAYFRRLDTPSDNRWSASLFISQLWLAVLTSGVELSRPSFLSLVEAQIDDSMQSSALDELLYWIKRWIQDSPDESSSRE